MNQTHSARAKSHMKTGFICPSLALIAHSALQADIACFTNTELYTKTGVICPLRSLLPHSVLSTDIARFGYTESACRQASFAQRSRCLLVQRSWQTLLYTLMHNLTCCQAPSAQISTILPQKTRKSTLYTLGTPSGQFGHLLVAR